MASNKSDACCWYLSARLQVLLNSRLGISCHESSSTLQAETEVVCWNEPCSTSGGWNCKKSLSLLPHLWMLILLSTHRTYLVLYTHTYIPKKGRFYEYILLFYSAASFHVCTFFLFSKISLRTVSNPQDVVPNCRFEGCESRGLLSLAPGRHHGDRCHACFCQCTLILTCSIPAIPVLGPSCAKFYSLFVYS